MTRPVSWIPLSLCLFVLVGCERDVFRLEIRPSGDRVERRLTGWHEKQSGQAGQPPQREALSQDVRNRLGAIYSDATRSADGIEYGYRGEFLAGKMPQDIGGAGEYGFWTSPMGSTAMYVERFRGNDDLEGQLEHRHAAANQAVDLFVGWMESLAGKHPRFGALREFLDGSFRRDLLNVGGYLWTMSASAESCGSEPLAEREAACRIGLYLCERGYLGFSDVPDVGFSQGPDSSQKLVTRFQRILAEKLGAGPRDPIPAELEILGQSERIEASLNDYLAQTPWFAARLAEWREVNKDRGETPPRAIDLFGELLSEGLLSVDIFANSADHLDVVVATPVEPFATCGTWSADAGEVRWSADLGEKRTLPALFYARWSLPDSAFQQQHFGRVVLEGEALASYVRWYGDLTPSRRDAWDQFLAALQPNADLAPQIEAYRFADEPPAREGEEAPASAADYPRQILAKGLQAP